MFSSLSMTDIGDLVDHMKKESYAKGSRIVRQGDKGDAFFIIYRGQVHVVRRVFLVLRSTLGWLGPGQFFGELALLNDAPRAAAVVAAENTECFVLLKGHFEHLVKKNPAFSGVMRELQKRRSAAPS